MREVIELIYREANGFDRSKITKSKIIKGCYKAMEKDGFKAKSRRRIFLKSKNLHARISVTSITEERESTYPDYIEEEESEESEESERNEGLIDYRIKQMQR